MSKLPYILALIVAISVILLSRYPPFWQQHPTLYEHRYDAQHTEMMSDYFEGLAPKPEVPTQVHRVLTGWLLSQIPGPDFKERWIKLTVLCLLIIGVSGWFIGLAFRNDWRVGALMASMSLASMGWFIGLLPWHKDTVVGALEFACLACILRRKWWAVVILLCLGMLAKETFMFYTLGVFVWLLITQYREWRRGNTRSSSWDNVRAFNRRHSSLHIER